jgi:hypothetical protein
MSTSQDILEIDDAIVLLLGASTRNPRLTPGHLEGITRLEKLIFLLERETAAQSWLSEDADFRPYNFGPFSSKVYQAVDMLAAAQIIDDSGANAKTQEDSWERDNVIDAIGPESDPYVTDPYVTRDFKLTDRGWRYYTVLLEQLPNGAIDELEDFKTRFAALSLRQLVRYVYQRYEDFTTRCVIRDEILGS